MAACHLRCKPAFLLGCEAKCAGNGVYAPGVSVTSVYPVWAGSAQRKGHVGAAWLRYDQVPTSAFAEKRDLCSVSAVSGAAV